VIVDETQKITFINSAFARMLGCAAGDILGHPVSEFLNDATQRSMAGKIEPRNPGDVQRYQHTWLRKNGTTIPTAISLRPTFDRRHRYSGSLRVVSNLPEFEGMQSIGEHPERERDFRAAVYSAVQRVSLDGILLVDSQEQIISYNQRFVEIWKVPYLLEGEAPQAVRCFVPAQQLGDVQIGPLLGETLVRNKQVSGKALAAALHKQAGLRQEKLGQHLLDRGIVSPEELKRALLSQNAAPQ
jgi:PAS domain S-box-containing protein